MRLFHGLFIMLPNASLIHFEISIVSKTNRRLDIYFYCSLLFLTYLDLDVQPSICFASYRDFKTNEGCIWQHNK